jgi:trypsin
MEEKYIFLCFLLFTGIVSYGFGCGKMGYPGLYTNVYYFLDWIKANT